MWTYKILFAGNGKEINGDYMTQIENIHEYMKTGKSITPIESLNLFGCFRLAAVIFVIKDLIKNSPYEVETEIVHSENGKHFARYSLKPKEELFLCTYAK
jgi:hypothetical protein